MLEKNFGLLIVAVKVMGNSTETFYESVFNVDEEIYHTFTHASCDSRCYFTVATSASVSHFSFPHPQPPSS